MASQATSLPGAAPQSPDKVLITHSADRALAVLNRRYWHGTASNAQLTTFILKLALTRVDLLDGWIDQVTRYCAAEGINPNVYLQHTLERLYPNTPKITPKNHKPKKGKTT